LEWWVEYAGGFCAWLLPVAALALGQQKVVDVEKLRGAVDKGAEGGRGGCGGNSVR